MNIIDGKKVSLEFRAKLKNKVSDLKKKGINPGLATILVGNNPASKVYVSSKIKACADLGIESFSHNLEETATKKDVIDLLKKLNSDSKVHGILLQLPLPEAISQEESRECLEEILHEKDVDGLHPYSLGQLFSTKTWEEIEKRKLFVPCTPLGIIYLLKESGIEIANRNAVVVGRSNLVGKPMAMLLLAHNATVTLAHSKTQNLKEICSKADILVAAIGKQRFITKDFIKKDAVVIDVGISRTDKGLCGDVDFDSAKEVAGYITPVPGGVGPMTIAMLMHNTVLASQKSEKLCRVA